MVPALGHVARAAARPVHRFQAFYVPNGMAMQYWLPKTEGRDFELTPILEPLAAFRQQMLVLSGLNSSWTYIHAGASGSFLTGTARGGRNEVEIIADVSMDQLLARQFATETQLARVSCPVGVDIDSRSVPEIAVSIMAQYIQQRARAAGAWESEVLQRIRAAGCVPA